MTERLITVGEFVETYHHGFIEAFSSYDGKKLFSTKRGKNYEKYKDCPIYSIWSEIRAGKSSGYSQIAHSVTCIHVSDFELRKGELQCLTE